LTTGPTVASKAPSERALVARAASTTRAVSAETGNQSRVVLRLKRESSESGRHVDMRLSMRSSTVSIFVWSVLRSMPFSGAYSLTV